ncbi:MAG: hypothetical protein R3A12_13575 [Ignavibacteria bacterium]
MFWVTEIISRYKQAGIHEVDTINANIIKNNSIGYEFQYITVYKPVTPVRNKQFKFNRLK